MSDNLKKIVFIEKTIFFIKIRLNIIINKFKVE